MKLPMTLPAWTDILIKQLATGRLCKQRTDAATYIVHGCRYTPSPHTIRISGNPCDENGVYGKYVVSLPPVFETKEYTYGSTDSPEEP